MAAVLTLNERAQRLADYLIANAAQQRLAVHTIAGARVVDCGVKVVGGLQAGLGLARVCLAGLADVSLVPGEVAGIACPQVVVSSDAPISACMASQYAGWQVGVGKYFAMGSGPMRAANGREEIFNHIGLREKPPVAVGSLESRKLPDDAVIDYLQSSLGLPADKITLLVAPAASLAGSLQVVARSLETALHKLHQLHFDLANVVSGFGSAPLPPVAGNELDAIGRTNDAILYGGQVHLVVRGDDAAARDLARRLPSRNAKAFGQSFAELFVAAGHDFYKIDPALFAPAEVWVSNLDSGSTWHAGAVDMALLQTLWLQQA